jgi:uncharacterized repeat protein (TIGR03943 family)
VSKEVQSILLLLVGGAALRFALTDAHLLYVKGSLQPFLLASGAVLIALGIVSALVDGVFRRTSRSAVPPEHHPQSPPAGEATQSDMPAGPGHDHAHGPRVAWLLMLPVFAMYLVAPPALGAYAAARDDGAVAAPADSYLGELPAEDPVTLTLMDYSVRALWDDSASLEGRTVSLTGFASPDESGGWFLTRMTLSCCAADGQAIKVKVVGAPSPGTDTWVRVVGRWVPPSAAGSPEGETGEELAVVEVADITIVDQPSDPYEAL